MSLLVKDYDAIVTTMVNHMAANTSVSDDNIGAVSRTFFEAVAIVVDETYFQLVDMLNGFYINSAQGSDLDKRLSDFGLQRLLAQPATLTLSFTANATLVPLQPIPSGTLVTVQGSGDVPSLTFVTTADGTADVGGGANIPAVCTTPGIVGNLPTIGFSTWLITNNPNPQVVTSVTNTSIGYNGFDQETDDSFRARGIAFLQSLSKGTNNSIISACLNAVNLSTSAPLGISQAKVLENYALIYDGSPTVGTQETQDLAGSIPPVSGAPTTVAILEGPQAQSPHDITHYGNIVVVVDNGQGSLGFSDIVPPLVPVINGDPSQPTIYPGYRAAGIQAFITRPSILTPVGITFTIKLEPTFLDTTSIIAACQSAVDLFVLQIPIGGTLYKSNIIDQCMEIPGILNVSNVVINSPSVDVNGDLPATDLATKITLNDPTTTIVITTTY
ncbi:Baseplate J-like protein [uncultured archaeon]|nr:Baseplate J-like protein [uncultured archaeon]